MNKTNMDESVSSESSLIDYDGTSTSGGSTNAGQTGPRKLEWKQSKAVQRSKILFFVGVLIAAVVCGTTTGILVRREEANELETQVRIPLYELTLCSSVA